MARKQEKRKTVLLHLDPALKKELEQLAEDDDRSVSNKGAQLLKQAIAANKLKESKAA